jgi:hypothetical protein
LQEAQTRVVPSPIDVYKRGHRAKNSEISDELCSQAAVEQIYLLMEGIDARKQPNAASGLVCSPKEEGGLGVIDVKKQNEVVLLKK